MLHAGAHAIGSTSDSRGTALDCPYCLSSAQLQIGLGAAEPSLPARSLAWTMFVPDVAAAEFRQPAFAAFRSRAPPALA